MRLPYLLSLAILLAAAVQPNADAEESVTLAKKLEHAALNAELSKQLNDYLNAPPPKGVALQPTTQPVKGAKAPAPLTVEKRTAIFLSRDLDHDGQLTRPEFIGETTDQAKANKNFDQRDTDKSGTLSKAEFEPLAPLKSAKDERAAPKRSARIDTPRPTGPGLVPADVSVLTAGTERLDLYLLIGQSNMKGRGIMPEPSASDPRIISMHLKDDHWYVARHPLHLTGDAQTYAGADNAGVGPGMAFAQAIAVAHPRSTIGLIPSAVGGTAISRWKPGASLYQEALRRAQRTITSGPKGKTTLRAVLWLQGEADANAVALPHYQKSLTTLVTALRRDFAIPQLPFIACTIGEIGDEPKRALNPALNEILKIK